MNFLKMIPSGWLMAIARFVLGRLHDYVDSLTPAQQQAFIDYVNRKIGGDKKIEAAMISILIEAVKTMLDNFTL